MGRLDDFSELLGARLAGKRIAASELREARKETDGLRRILDEDRWVKDHAVGSRNFGPVAAAALGDYRLIIRICEVELEQGINGLEAGTGNTYVSTAQVGAKMAALRMARETGDERGAAIIARCLRGGWAMALLATGPWPRRRDELVCDGKLQTKTSRAFDGVTCALVGNRHSHHLSQHSKDFLTGNVWSYMVSWAFRFDRSSLSNGKKLRDFFGPLLGKQRYTQDVPSHFWGLTDEEVEVGRRLIVDADRSALRHVVSWFPGVKVSWGEAPAWSWIFGRTTEVVYCGFEGPWPNSSGGKGPLAYAEINAEGRYRALKPTDSGKNLGDYELQLVRGDGGRVAKVRSHIAASGWTEIAGPDGDVLYEVQAQGIAGANREDLGVRLGA